MENLDWSNLSFRYRKTNAIIISNFKEGKWSEPRLSSDFDFHLSAFAGVLHYASSCFEGLKAFRGVDGKVRVFRPYENAKRMKSSAAYLDIACPDEELFVKMCLMCVKENIDFLPPFGYGSSLYIRPLLFGTNPQLGVNSSTEVCFAVMCAPVGTYSGAKNLSAGKAVIARNYDRAAPNGSGCYKLSANYAPSFHPYNLAHGQGYRELLFLDPASKTYIDEYGSSNFLAIKDNTYITPLSESILPSITNNSLQVVAADLGMKVEKRKIRVEELAEMSEVNACGTAVVITPICSIDDKVSLEDTQVKKTYTFGDGENCGKISEKMYHRIRGIQNGEEEDIHSWCIGL